MGTSTNAILMYGVAIEDEWECPDAEDEDDNDLPGNLWDEKQADGPRLEHHCSDGCTMYVLGMTPLATAYRGDVRVISPAKMTKDPEADRAILAYAAKPAWLLFSWWG